MQYGSLMALGIGPGDEVITNANTFFAIAEAIWIVGAKVVLVDCGPKTKCIDPRAAAAAVNPKTKAIIAVHLYGHTADMKAIKAIAEKHSLAVIEDNAQSIDESGIKAVLSYQHRYGPHYCKVKDIISIRDNREDPYHICHSSRLGSAYGDPHAPLQQMVCGKPPNHSG